MMELFLNIDIASKPLLFPQKAPSQVIDWALKKVTLHKCTKKGKHLRKN